MTRHHAIASLAREISRVAGPPTLRFDVKKDIYQVFNHLSAEEVRWALEFRDTPPLLAAAMLRDNCGVNMSVIFDYVLQVPVVGDE